MATGTAHASAPRAHRVWCFLLIDPSCPDPRSRSGLQVGDDVIVRIWQATNYRRRLRFACHGEGWRFHSVRGPTISAAGAATSSASTPNVTNAQRSETTVAITPPQMVPAACPVALSA